MGIFIKKYLWVVHLFLVALGAYFLAKITSTWVADNLMTERKVKLSVASVDTLALNKIPPSSDYYKIILDRNIFDSKEASAPLAESLASEPETLDLNGPAVKTSLPVKLLSTFSVGEGSDRRSTATLQADAKGSPDVYTVGDEKQFAPGTKITKILSDRIEFINANRLEYVELENIAGKPGTGPGPGRVETKSPSASGGVSKQSDSKFVIDQSEVDNALNNLDKLFTEMRIVPNIVSGKSQGMKIVTVSPSSLFGKLGLQRGDVIERINGMEMDIARGMQIFNQLKGEKKISIDLSRNGQKQTLDYEIR